MLYIATATAIDDHIVNNNNDDNGLYYWEDNDLNSEMMDLTNYVDDNKVSITDHLIPTITTTTSVVNGLCFSEEENDNIQVVNSEMLMMMGLNNYVDQSDTEEERAGLEEHQQLCLSIDDFDFEGGLEVGTDNSTNYDHYNMVAA
ncbi:hypothetical protein FRX31_020453, partial [Thalictrum thalictroides]